jgi:hypothetical protein
LTAYDQNTLNNSDSYSVGAYADWSPTPALHIQPRAGYTSYIVEQTSAVIPASNASTWYGQLSLRNDITSTVTFLLLAGRETRGGVETDLIQDWYVRPNLIWKAIQNVTVAANYSYEHGAQSQGSAPGTAFGGEEYDDTEAGVTLSYRLTKRITLSMSGRFIVRASNVSANEYSQDSVGLRLNYQLL